MTTNQDIQSLIKMPKKIYKKNPKKGYKLEKMNKRCDLTLCQSHLQIQTFVTEKSHTELKSENITEQDKNIEFTVFTRQNQKFLENFSIGLRCYFPDLKKTVTLIRYNGPHGSIKRSKTDHHSYPHIHHITQEEIQSGSFNPKPKNIEKTDKYNTFEEGLRAFLMDMKVSNWKKYFPELEQMELFNGY